MPRVTASLRLLRSKEREEHVEGDLDGVDVRDAPLVGDELEVDEVHQRPHLPRSLAGGQEVVLDLAADGREGISVDEAEVGEEHAHEDGAPEELIDGDLREDGGGVGSGDLLIEPVVEVVSGGAVVDESEERQGREALVVDGSSGNEELRCRIHSTSPMVSVG